MDSIKPLFIMASVISPPLLYAIAVNAIFKKINEESAARYKEFERYHTHINYRLDSPEFAILSATIKKDKWIERIYLFLMFLAVPLFFVMINIL